MVKVADNKIYVDIAERMVKARMAKGLKQKEAAKHLGILATNLSNLENGKVKTNTEILMNSCRLYNISADYLLFGKIENDDYVTEIGEMALAYTDIVRDLEKLEDPRDVAEIRDHIQGLLWQQREKEDDNEDDE